MVMHRISLSTVENRLFMAKKSLKVDRKKFEGIVQSLLQAKPLKREKVKVAKTKPEKLFPPPLASKPSTAPL
jgi:hypothetical protein